MKKTIGMVLAVAALLGFGATAAMACQNLGPNTHLILVQAVDLEEGRLTGIDAEAQEPMTFTASEKILKGLEMGTSYVVVFKMADDEMEVEQATPVTG